MKVNREKIKQLIDTYCEGNYARFAREVDIDTSHLHRFVNKGIGGGKKVLGGVMRFCKDKNINFEDYIDL
ncbi:MAG: hypothetical protein N3B21_17395 [Clostridia bacterium]|nr:hypothetical protein [Clostridia bacterium]